MWSRATPLVLESAARLDRTLSGALTSSVPICGMSLRILAPPRSALTRSAL
jgi:hypothetical protein